MATPPPLSRKEDLKSSRFWGRGIRIWIIQLIVAAAITGVLTSISLDYVESFFFDYRTTHRILPKQSGKIQIVLIDEQTIKRFKAIPGFAEHLKVLEKIKSQNPTALVYIREFTSVDQEMANGRTRAGLLKGTKEDQLRFAQLAGSFENFFMQSDSLERADEKEKLRLVAPFDRLRVGSGPKTSDRNILARDGVSRRILISYQDQILMHPKLAAKFNPEILDVSKIKGSFNLFDSQQVYIDFVAPNSFSQIKFEDIYDDKVDLSQLKGKLILIGDDIGASARDYAATPFNRDATMTVTELHANMFDTLIRNSAPVTAPKWLDIIFTFFICCLTLSISLSMKPMRGIYALLGTGLSFSLVAWILFWLKGFSIEMSHPLLAIFTCYYFLIPYRLIIENRRSWEYYQKHKILQQVEEMKTNFISMMSHDLKTPIARIQGMTEIIGRDKTILSTTQQEAVDTIRSSSVDLLGTINSILSYARIENQGVELNLQAKDINESILEVVKRHEFLAKLKHIKILTELEPLFSISIDPELMKQVFSNLLENAIKYSPDHSTVIIKTLEEDGQVNVKFIDNGFGIPEDELPHVFMKFFRSKNVKSSPIKGSGLGLYLAKYLIELHQGSINVESTPGKGTTFTVKLPLRQN